MTDAEQEDILTTALIQMTLNQILEVVLTNRFGSGIKLAGFLAIRGKDFKRRN